MAYQFFPKHEYDESEPATETEVATSVAGLTEPLELDDKTEVQMVLNARERGYSTRATSEPVGVVAEAVRSSQGGSDCSSGEQNGKGSENHLQQPQKAGVQLANFKLKKRFRWTVKYKYGNPIEPRLDVVDVFWVSLQSKLKICIALVCRMPKQINVCLRQYNTV